MRHSTLIAALWLSVVAGVVAPGEARAQAPESSEDRAAALGREGLSLFDQGRWLEANSKFQQAQKIARSPVFDLYSARALRNAGRLLEAEGVFRRVLEEELPARAPEAFAKAKADAKREHGQLVERIPKVRIRPSRVIAADGEVSLDGETVNAAVARLVDPGKHTIIVREAGKEVARKEVDVRDGAGTLEVELPLSGAGAAAEPPGVEPKKVAPSSEGSLLPGALVLAGGAASLIIGGVTGGLAMSAKSDLEEACPDGRCPESSRETFDDATRLATASTATFIIGGVLAAGGVTLLILRPGSSGDEAKAAVSLGVSPNWLGVRGRF